MPDPWCRRVPTRLPCNRMARRERIPISDEPVTAYFDGLCEPNPGGHGCGGWVVEPHDALQGEIIKGHEYFGYGDGITNNVCEYRAALKVLSVLWMVGYRGPVELRGDSQLVVRQFEGVYACNAPLLVPLLARLRKAREAFAGLSLVWIPRFDNQAADEESRAAYREATGREVPERIDRHKDARRKR